ncbi:MAG: hypothetical protein JWM57_634, partial [Phycisphaerales bacterium]|nr:hypothetical protein [Phycisphaerales bacterium]
FSELALTVTGTRFTGYKPPQAPAAGTVLSIFGNDTPSTLFSFSTPVTQVALSEYLNPLTSVTLFADAAGTQQLGTLSTTHTASVYPNSASIAFQSDTPFRSFTVAVGGTGSYQVNDLRYTAVPEPIAFAAIGVVAVASCLRRRRV